MSQSKDRQTASQIDINCDLGEGDKRQDCERDALLMPYLTRCNIACGGHAGNQLTMQQSLINARAHGLKVGAHPGYADKAHFGRRSISLPFNQLSDSLCRQIDQLLALAARENMQLEHIKCHGALYNDAEKSFELSEKLVDLFKNRYPDLAILGLAQGHLQQAAASQQQTFIREGFIDRAYQLNGQLLPRNQAGAVHEESHRAITQALALATRKPLQTVDGQELIVRVDSICLHGDNPQTLAIARKLFSTLQAHVIQLK